MLTMIETTTFHALISHLVAEHGEDINNAKQASLTEWRCWVPDISGWSEQLCLEGQDDLAECWDQLSAEEQSAMLRDVADLAHDELAAARELLA